MVVVIVAMTLTGINVILHGTGFYLLFYLYNRGKGTPQRIFVMNLSLCELVQNISRLSVYAVHYYNEAMKAETHNLRNPASVWNKTTLGPASNNASVWNNTTLGSTGLPPVGTVQTVIDYMQLIINSGVYYLCYTSMVLLTSDRLLCIWLHVRYRKCWTVKKTFGSIAIAWVLCAFITAALITYAYLNEIVSSDEFKATVSFYTLTPLLSIFLVFATMSYAVMFFKFLSSSRTTSSRRRSQHTIFYTFRHSRFFISVLLVVSYLVFMVLPNLTCTTLKIAGVDLPKVIYPVNNVCVILSDTADGFIYVFLQTSVKRLLFRQTNLRRSGMSKPVSTVIPSSPDFNRLKGRVKEMMRSPRLQRILRVDNCTPSDTEDEVKMMRDDDSPLVQSRIVYQANSKTGNGK